MRSPGQCALIFARCRDFPFSPNSCEVHTRLPETPLASFHDPEAEKKVGDGVGQNARRQAFRPIRDAIVERARNEGRDPVRRRMGKPEPDGHNREGEPGKRSNRDGMEFFVNEIAKQESAPKNLLDQRNDDYEANKTDCNRGPVCGWLAGKNLGIEANETRREAEQEAWGAIHNAKTRSATAAAKTIRLAARN